MASGDITARDGTQAVSGGSSKWWNMHTIPDGEAHLVLFAAMSFNLSTPSYNYNRVRTLRKDETVPLLFDNIKDVVGITLNGGDDLSFLYNGSDPAGDVVWTLTLLEL